MKIRNELILQLIQQAIFDGVSSGLEASVAESQKPENKGNPNIIAHVVSIHVFSNIASIIDFGYEPTQTQSQETETVQQ